MLSARPSTISAAPFPSGDGSILQRRATTLLLAQAAQGSVDDSALAPVRARAARRISPKLHESRHAQQAR
jgi:hypothetical protein